MFSKQKNPLPQFSLGGLAADPKAQKSKPLSAAERYQQAVVTANVFVEDSRARMQREMNKYNAVANSTYWFYGYFGANMGATLAVCMGIGNRIPLIRSYSGWIALAGGYFGGKACLAVHSQYLLANVVKQLDHEVEEAKRMDEQTKGIVTEYRREAERLTNVKYELMPTLPEAAAARESRKELSLEDKVDTLIEAYQKRKQALQTK